MNGVNRRQSRATRGTPVPTRNPPSLSEILAEFNAARTPKTASDDPAAAPAESPDASPGSSSTTAAGQSGLAAAVDDVAEAARKLDQAKKEEASATNEIVDAAQALKDIALDAVKDHTDALSKEAQLFGEIFGAAAFAALRKTAAHDAGNKAERMSTDMDKLSLLRVKLAEVYDEAYAMALSKLAGDEETLAALRQLGCDTDDPEAVAALLQQLHGEAESGPAQATPALYPQALSEATTQSAAPTAPAPQTTGAAPDEAAALDAANMLAAELQAREQAQAQAMNLPDLTHAAYAEALRQLGN